MPQFILDLGSPEQAIAFRALSEFTQGYVEAALWAEEEQLAEELEGGVSVNDLSPELWASMVADCSAFEEANRIKLDQAHELYGRSRAHCGHDFWLTRNGHGTGFWDRGMGLVGKNLDMRACAYSSVDLYVGDDGLVYGA